MLEVDGEVGFIGCGHRILSELRLETTRSLCSSGLAVDDAIRLDGCQIDVGYPEDRDRAEERLDELALDPEIVLETREWIENQP